MAFLTITSFAQKDKKATDLLSQVSAKTKSYKTLKVEFSYNMDNSKANIHESKSGTLSLQGDKYRLNIAGQTVISDGKTTWTYIKDANEVQVNSVADNEEAFTPTRLLSSYNENYKSKIVKGKTSDPNSITVELVPLKGKNYSRVLLVIDKEKKQPKSFSVYDKNGNVFSYKINKSIFFRDLISRSTSKWVSYF